jgi:hypothetical protein
MAIQDIVEKYISEKKAKKQKTPFDKIRKPTAPPRKVHKDKKDQSRSKVKQDMKKLY